MAYDLIAIGNVCADIFLPPHDPPQRGGLALVPSLEVVPGGNGLNTAAAAARLGVRTALAGALGDDLVGRGLRAFLERERVDVSLLRLLPGRTSPATIVLNDETGERSFIHHPGTNRDFDAGAAAAAAPTRIFHLAAPELLGSFWPRRCAELARTLRARGVVISLDAILSPSAAIVEDHRPLLELTDIALPNEEEARAITGRRDVADAVRHLLDLGVRVAAIKRGAAGALVAWEGGTVEVPTRKARAVDTCGAGDNFAGGFLAAWLRGLDPVGCAEIGCAMGTRCVEYQGSLTGTADPDFLASLRRRLENR